MASYKEIHGTNIETVSSDPSNPVIGQVWYNSTEQKLKGFTSNPAGTWAAGNAMNTARYGFGAGGTQTSALAFGGGETPPLTRKDETESYNGTSWTEVADLGTARYATAGTASSSTAALAFSGTVSPSPASSHYSVITETWDGSSWTEVGDLNIGRSYGSGCGNSNTAALFVGGYGGSPDVAQAYVESWNGSAWTEVGDLNAATYTHGSFGTNTAAICFGGLVPGSSFSNRTESWNGSAWTEVADLNTGKRAIAGSGAGTSTAGLGAGGFVSGNNATGKTETWNGSAWSEEGDLSTARSNLGNAGTTTAGLGFGGYIPGPKQTAVSEEWTSPTTSTVDFDVS